MVRQRKGRKRLTVPGNQSFACLTQAAAEDSLSGWNEPKSTGDALTPTPTPAKARSVAAAVAIDVRCFFYVCSLLCVCWMVGRQAGLKLEYENYYHSNRLNAVK